MDVIEISVPIICGVIALLLTMAAAWHWRGGRYLCSECRFNNSDDCKKAERPKASKCLAFRQKTT